MGRSYWLDLFTLETWEEFLAHGADVSGFSEKRWKTVRRMKPGDYLLCYLTRYSRWVGVLEVTGDAFRDVEPIWESKVFPSRIPVEIVVSVPAEHGVPVLDMRSQLTVFEGLDNPNRWSGPFRGSPAKWKQQDGEAVLAALQEAKANPVHRPLTKKTGGATTEAKQLRVETDEGDVTIPSDEENQAVEQGETEGTTHTEIQYLLLKLGSDMGLDVYVANNDRSRTWRGRRLGDLPRMRDTLPQQFDPATNKIIQLIDVLWLDGNAIVAAFEVESTTSIYSGLLRMSDLVSMQPNLAIPLFLVAAEDWRSRVITQINRPTFARMKPPLVDICRYIAFEDLREALASTASFVVYLKPDFLQSISESCEAEG